MAFCFEVGPRKEGDDPSLMTQERLDEILAEASKYCNQPTDYYCSNCGTLIMTIKDGDSDDKVRSFVSEINIYGCPFCGGSLTDKPPQDENN